MKKRIETTTSRTAAWTCVSRAASSLEASAPYRSDDHIARLLLPTFLRLLLHIPFVRTLYREVVAPKGIYEYVVARTQYIDAVFREALREQFDQILLFGAGFDTRALRFQAEARNTRVFELDASITQQAKLRQYRKRNLTIPPNVVFIAIDFDKESLPLKLDAAGFNRHQRSLFVLEGLVMYLRPESVQETFGTIQDYAGEHSWVVFDYIFASVLRHENTHYGEADIVKTVSQANEHWHFGIEKGNTKRFLSAYGFRLRDHKDAEELEDAYFKDSKGELLGRVNGTHCLVTAEKC